MLKDLLAKKGKDFPLIIAFGDSVTQGCFALTADEEHSVTDYDAVYHQVLRRQLNFLLPQWPINVLNAGVGGDNVHRGLERLQTAVLQHKPDVVIVCFGLNDVPGGEPQLDGYRQGLTEILIRIQQAGAIPVFMTPNMLNTRVIDNEIPDRYLGFAEVTAKMQNSGVMDTYMEAAREVCRQHKVVLCDCYAKWKKMEAAGVDTTMLLCNRINHPNKEMHRLFADSLTDCLLSLV